MKIDVINAYKKAKSACATEDIQDFITDIFRFINYISIDDGKKRFYQFYEIFDDTDYLEYVLNIEPNKIEFPTLDYAGDFRQDFIDFFIVLGKYYIFNRDDKKFIDKFRYTEFIRTINGVETNHKTNKNEKRASNLAIDIKDEPTFKDRSTENQADIQADKPIEESLDKLLDELHSLIGLEGVKKEVEQIINLIKVRKKAEELGEKVGNASLHLVFYGNPGTGKTTVARLLSKIYKALGVLSEGQFVEVDRGGLVGGYVGQTAIKTQEVIESAIGGILFIDEAYALTHGKGESDFGQEAVDTILKAMEDHRDNFIVIVAGYPDLMKEFIASNPGLKSRFNQYILFEDYEPQQLKEIFELLCRRRGWNLTDECAEFLDTYFKDMYENRTDDYANGRDVRNYFEKVERMQANRLSKNLNDVSREDLQRIIVSDLEKAKKEISSKW